jgi:hypothetical protein
MAHIFDGPDDPQIEEWRQSNARAAARTEGAARNEAVARNEVTAPAAPAEGGTRG